MRIANAPTQTRSQEASLQTLQNAIVRLATKQPVRPGTPQQRQELNALVEQALEAYREYMKAMAH